MKKGFTLIEVICAVAILSIIMVMFSSLFTNSLTMSSTAQKIDNSSSISKSFIEQNKVNDGSVIGEEKNITFSFGTESVVGRGEVFNTGGDVSYSVLVADSSEFNSSGWSSGWDVAGTNDVVNTPVPTATPTTAPTATPTATPTPSVMESACMLASEYGKDLYTYGNNIFVIKSEYLYKNRKNSTITLYKFNGIDSFTYYKEFSKFPKNKTYNSVEYNKLLADKPECE
jgi:prepilin-type N-terminal cleavage/methylation domain-containing protein